MIDCFHFSEKELLRLGIAFLNPDDAKGFIDYIKQRLDAIIGEELINKLQTEDDYHDSVWTAFRVIKDRNNTDNEHPDYQTIVERAQIDLIWNVFLHRDELERATIDHKVDRAETLIQEAGVSNLVCIFFNEDGINTIGDVLQSDKLSKYEKDAPEMFDELRSSILDFLFPDLPQEKVNNVTTRFVRTPRLDDYYYKCKISSPDEVLEELKNYIQNQAYAYCNGECTLNEFIIHTYSPFVAVELTNAKYNSMFRSAAGFEEKLLQCYNTWKNNRTITAEHSFDDLFPHNNDISKTLEWFFIVIDTLLIPIEFFFSLDYFYDLEEKDYPNIITAVRNTTERLSLADECLDIDKLTDDIASKNKTFSFVFSDETTATVTIREIGSTFYRGYGIIDGYMSEEGEIEIEADKNGYWFYFDKKVFSEIDVVLMTTDHPVPHPRWSKYNSAVKQKKRFVKEKYDEKRNNYMKGLTQ